MDFTIIPRSAWGARHERGFGPAPLPASEVWLHHSVTAAPADDPAAERAAMRTLESIGEQRFGRGISYTWLIPPSGRIYDGHGVDRQGAHTGGRNDRARAICFIGNYEANRPTAAQVRSAAWLLRHAKGNGWIRAARLNGGHRDLKATACPGRFAYAVIDDINRLAAGGPITEEVDLDAKQDQNLAQLHEVIVSGRKTDARYNRDLAYVVSTLGKQISSVQGAISAQEARILAAVAADGTHPVDVHELSDALVTQLGPDLGEALVNELASRLNSNREGN